MDALGAIRDPLIIAMNRVLLHVDAQIWADAGIALPGLRELRLHFEQHPLGLVQLTDMQFQKLPALPEAPNCGRPLSGYSRQQLFIII